jgi:hypothetical protein
VQRLGKPASHGCVRLSQENAATLHDLVARNGLENTEVMLIGLTPGGEGKVASPGRSKSQYTRAARSYESYTKPRRRGGFSGDCLDDDKCLPLLEKYDPRPRPVPEVRRADPERILASRVFMKLTPRRPRTIQKPLSAKAGAAHPTMGTGQWR